MNLNAITLGLRTILPGEYSPAASFDFLFGGSALDSRITFTGASARMYFDSTGTLRYAPMNLLIASSDFNDAAWDIKTNVTLTSGISDPFGGTSAWTMKRTSGASSAVLGDSFTGNSDQTYTGAWYVRRRSGAGTVDLVVGDNVNQTISPTSSWQRLSASNTTTSTTIRQYISLTGAGTDEIDIAFSSINLGTEVFDYIPTTTAAVYLPRSNAYQDHNPSTLAPLGFLIEEQRTNLVLWNREFGTVGVWGLTGTTQTANTDAAPDGTLTMDSIFETAANSEHFVRQNFTGLAANSTHTVSVFVKDLGGRNLKIRVLNSDIVTDGFTARFSPSLGTIVTAAANIGSGTGATASIASVGGGVYRVTLSGNAGATCTKYTLDFFSNSGTSDVFAGDITKGVILWGAQLELGAFATSPILTTGAAATRLADVASITGTNFSSFWNQTEGTIVLGFRPPSTAIDSAPVTANGGTDANRIGFDTTPTSFGRLVVDSSSVSQVLIGTSGVSQGALNKFAGTYKVNDFAISKAGAAPSTDTSGTVPTVDRLQIGSRVGAVYLNGHIQSLAYYNKRLPNQTIQSLTV
jgi:hypothetical protein